MSKKSQRPDVRVTRAGLGLFLFRPLTQPAKAWIAENVGSGPDTTYWGDALVVEHRYAEDLTEGMLNSGLRVA